MNWLGSLKKAFARKASKHDIGQDEDTVYYAGPDTSDVEAKQGDYWFWIDVPASAAATVELPAVTSDPAIIARLKRMKNGDAFKITKESAEGGLGTRVHSIEVISASGPASGPASAPACFAPHKP